jgi:hypothetical protein
VIRVTTDRRDSQMFARLHRAGELRAIDVPDDTDEAMRDLLRAREDAVAVGIQAKYRVKAFLLRQGRRSPGREGWTLAYRRWLADLSSRARRSTAWPSDIETTVQRSRSPALAAARERRGRRRVQRRVGRRGRL